MDLLDRYGISPEAAWIGAFVALIVGVAGSALVFTERVFYGFLWQYFWGPVRADADEADCVAYLRDEQRIVADPPAGCSGVENAFVAEPGYTVVSTVGYILVLIFMLAGVYLLLDRFVLEPYDRFLYALVPFMLFGGALRTVEDSFVAAQRAGEAPAIEFPASAALISPFIYFTVFGIALGALLVSKWLETSGYTDTYHYPLGIAGTVSLAAAFLYLLSITPSNDWIRLYPTVLLATLGLATLFAWGIYTAVDRYRPAIHAGTGLVGLVVIWGHAVDGLANVFANDWTQLWHGGTYGAKHPFNQLIIDTTNAIQGGESVAGVHVGDSWPFLLVKLAVPVLILAVFDEGFLDENPRYAFMLLGAIIAVGLGPGTRDMIRLAFAI
mgnify:CR=1 FL=1